MSYSVGGRHPHNQKTTVVDMKVTVVDEEAAVGVEEGVAVDVQEDEEDVAVGAQEDVVVEDAAVGVAPQVSHHEVLILHGGSV